jgi:flagellar basal body-associated protein FliL
MQFRVPQFIDLEDKVVGPLTLKQFGYILGAGGFSFIIWTFIPIRIIAILLIIIVAGLFLALAFVKINNRPFADLLESAFAFYTGSKVYTWKQPTEDNKNKPEAHIEQVVAEATKEVTIAKANKDRLHELSLGLDVLDRNPQEDESL